ncbi:DUF4350 domain-containing protein [Cellulosimicrobium marinum]|uniref:DUF4350 domain-containing protein n=1 Tax=Cellulosimicrobium marinum TaxID=1638992 RepID=UPI001E45A3AC|nr:DUF4350 domain-containing protein [Cellulosimicrobium marinum]MCB7137223.1 DUF4350 domain-containing protein [Cellulosimicrobium marinum]
MTTTPAPPTERTAPAAAPGVVTTTHVVVGDGTSAASRARARWRRARWPLAVLVLLLAVAGLAAISRPPTSGTPLAPDNPGPNGARALAEVLRDQGVEITYVQTVADAVGAAAEGTTLLVAQSDYLLDEQADALAATPADLVLVSPTEGLLSAATGGAAELAYDWPDGSAVRTPDCTDPAAQAAGALRSDGVGFLLAGTPDAASLCFPSPGDPTVGAYLVHDDGTRTVRAVDTPALLRNDAVAEDGRAALALWSLGAHDRLVWLVPDPFDTTLVDDGPEQPAAMLPPWTGVVALQLLVVVLVVALWRGRRLGPLVTEDLPVVVRASETTRGRGRLYRRAGARGHAAAGLRAGAADRLASRLGLPRSADAPSLVDAVARATGRPADQVAQLLYGPPPADDAALLELARHLDQIESEVYHS